MKNFQFPILLLSATILFFPLFTNAAKLSVVASPSVTLGQQFRVDVAVNTQGDAMNAIQGEIVFSPALFTFEGINDGESPVSLWIEAPHEVTSGTIAFSGVIPGGFTGSASSVVGVIFAPAEGGAGLVGIQNAKLLRNDGVGSEIPLVTVNQMVAVSAPAGASRGPGIPFTVPGSFKPMITRDANVYGGKYFLVFATTDKGSGIGYYDVLEVPAGTPIGANPPWITATSPYLLNDQTLASDVYVRAVNNAGGATIAEVPARTPQNAASRVSVRFAASLLVFFVLLVLIAVRFRRRRRLPLDAPSDEGEL
jgi:hypothetical protein